MEPGNSIRRLGFWRWYERQLIEAHAWFITAFICIISIAAFMEELSFHGPLAQLLLYAGLVAAAALLGFYGLVRYQKILMRAERVGAQATCAGCNAYGRFSMISASHVRCRKCGNEWRLISDAAATGRPGR
jgi:hypothetical protein